MKTWEKMREQPELIERYVVREKVIDTIRGYFKEQGFHEMFTPVLVPVPSAESNLEVFETELRTAKGKKRRGFLIMSPEYALKKLLAAGMGNIFEITKAFRNEEEVSSTHNHEFTILEWYRVGTDYRAIMADFEEMFVEIIKTVKPEVDLKKWRYQEFEYDISLPWLRLSVAEAFKNYCGIDLEILLNEKLLKEAAKNKGCVTAEETTWEQVFYQLFFNEIELKLKESRKPVIIYDYPLAQAALARRKPEDGRLAERFEVFLAGLELGNCFSELTDPREQRQRFESDLAERKKQGKTEYPIDEDLIEALGSMPQAAGIAVGVDRLVMLAADVENIAETLLFPGQELFEI